MPTEHDLTKTHCCQHYPNRVLHKKDVALELGVCERTVTNLMNAGHFVEPCWLNSKPVWMLYDLHAYISAQAGNPRPEDSSAERRTEPTKRTSKATKSTTHKAGKYCV